MIIRQYAALYMLTGYKIDYRYFCRAVESHGYSAYAGTPGGIASHATQLPLAMVEFFPFKLMAYQWYSFFKTDLAPMGMTAQIKIVSLARGYPRQFRSMNHGYFKIVTFRFQAQKG